MPEPKVEILSRDADHVIAVTGNVLVQIWLNNVSHEAALVVDKAGDRLSARQTPFVTLIVVGADAKPPQVKAREILTTFAARHAAQLALAVQVVEATGLKGAIMRSIMTGMSMMVKQVRVLIVRSVDEALVGCAGTDLGMEPDALREIIRGLQVAATGSAAPHLPRSARF